MMRATDVALRLALRRYPRSWRGRCPSCDYPGNTFAVRAGSGGVAHLYCSNGCDQDALAEAVARVTGHPSPAARSDTDADRTTEHKRERALRLWAGSEPAIGTLADRYLTARGLPGLAASAALRFRGDTPHPEGGRLSALIALVTDMVGRPMAIHRTYLARDGSKARVEPTRASLGSVWGGGVQLQPLVTGVPLIVGEGIESSASAGRLMAGSAWAAISAGNLAASLLLPPEALDVVIAADPDEAGRDAARAAWLRWTKEGRKVRIATPDGLGDFNDLLLAREPRHG